MSKKKKLRFDFPTDEKRALELMRLQADLRDLADGEDDVDESDGISREYLEDLWRSGATPTVGELAERAARRNNLTGYAEPPDDVPLATSDTEIGWRDIARALEKAEKQHVLDARTIVTAMAGLGFERKAELEKKAGCLVFSRDKRYVGIRVFRLGNIRGAEIAVARKKKHKGDDFGDFDELERGSSGTYVGGTLIAPHFWDEIVDGMLDRLERAKEALEEAGEEGRIPKLPIGFAPLKNFIDRGKDEEKQLEDEHELTEIGEKQARIRDLWLELNASGRAPRGIVLAFDGPDGAGKTSSSKFIPAALLAANDQLDEEQRWTTRTEIFKAPTDDDKRWMAEDAGAEFGLPPWLARHVKRGMPQEREILVKDRFQPGDYVYVGEHTSERLKRMAEEDGRYEQLLRSRGILVFKAILWADLEKQAKTFGKRMARGAFVDALIDELRDRGQLTDQAERDLISVKEKVENTDMVALTRFEEVLPLYKEYAEATECPVLESTDRHEARLELLDRFHDALSDFGSDEN